MIIVNSLLTFLSKKSSLFQQESKTHLNNFPSSGVFLGGDSVTSKEVKRKFAAILSERQGVQSPHG